MTYYIHPSYNKLKKGQLLSIATPHNNFFIQFFSDKNNLVELIKFVLPEGLISKIELNSLNILKDSFVSNEL
ncbi:MAG: Rpn family recombination-promoting nuclease/putative transposase, partial [Brevinematia bacterium]